MSVLFMQDATLPAGDENSLRGPMSPNRWPYGMSSYPKVETVWLSIGQAVF